MLPSGSRRLGRQDSGWFSWRSRNEFLNHDEAAERLSSDSDVVGRLATVLAHVALFGAVREADEGGAAHIFQLLMIGQEGALRDLATAGGPLPGIPRSAP